MKRLVFQPKEKHSDDSHGNGYNDINLSSYKARNLLPSVSGLSCSGRPTSTGTCLHQRANEMSLDCE